MSSELAAVERTMRILELLSQQPEGISVTELSAQLSLLKSNVSRILSTLEAGGYVVQDQRGGLFHLTWRIVTMAYRYADALPFEEIARPILRQLAQETSENVQLAVVEGDDLLFVSNHDGVKPLRVSSLYGRTAPLHATAAGKAYLSTLPEDRALALVTSRGMPALTPRTITDPRLLLEELRKVREQGFAVAWEEANLTVVALAAPILAAGGSARAVLAITIPAFEATPERLEELRQSMDRCTRTLAERLPPSNR